MDLAALVRSPRFAPPRASALRGLGDAWRLAETALAVDVARDPRAGRRIVSRFAALATRAGEREAIGRAARLRASAHARAGAWKDSAAAYREAIPKLDGLAKEGARLGLAGVLLRDGRHAAARTVAQKVETSARSLGDVRVAAMALRAQAVSWHESGTPERALAPYRAALDVFEDLGDVSNAAHTQRNLANALVLLDRYADASPLYDEAAAAFDALGADSDAAACRYNRGALLLLTDRLADAETALDDAERGFRSAGMAADADVVLAERGELLARARLLPEARRTFERALGSAARMSDDERRRTSLRLARVLGALGDDEAARRMLANVGGTSREAVAEQDDIAGRLRAAQGDLAGAVRLLERSAVRSGRFRPAAAARAYAAAAHCAADRGDAKTALRLAARAGALAKTVGTASLRFAHAAAAFSAARCAARGADASKALRAAFAAVEEMRAGLASDAMRAALLCGSERWLGQAVRHVLDAEGPRAALALAERWRARSLVDLLGSPAGRRDEDQQVAALRARLAALESAATSSSLPAFVRSGEVLTRPASGAARRAIETAESELRRALRATKSPESAPALDLDGLLAAIPRGTAVVSLHSDDDGTLAFVLRRGSLTLCRSGAKRRDIAQLVEELRYHVGKFALGPEFAARHESRLRADADAVLAEMAVAAIDPLASVVGGAERLVVVPGGPWSGVPFAALPWRGARLVDALPVAFTPALAALASRGAGHRSPRTPGPSVVVSFADELAPSIDAESAAVLRALPGATILRGAAANSAAVKELTAPRCLHVASHGRFRSDAPEMSGVRLADGWFRAIEWPTLDLRGSLVVLSGCETGVTQSGSAQADGGEVEGLVRGVFAAGARDAVVSLWRVGDAAAARSMEEFHRERAGGAGNGNDVAGSLRTMQRRAAARGEHPWSWAAFAHWTRTGRALSAADRW